MAIKNLPVLAMMASVFSDKLFSNNNHNNYQHQSSLNEITNEQKIKIKENASFIRSKKEHNREFMKFHASRGKRPTSISKKEWMIQSHSLFKNY